MALFQAMFPWVVRLSMARWVSGPRQGNRDGEQTRLKQGKTVHEIWPDQPAKAAEQDTDGRWTVKFSKAKTKEDGIDLAISPPFGDNNPIAIDRRFGFIRSFAVTDAAKHDGIRLFASSSHGTTPTLRYGGCDTAYRSKANETWLERHGRISRIHHQKPKGKPMPQHMARDNAAKSRTRALVEHVFGEQKSHIGLFI